MEEFYTSLDIHRRMLCDGVRNQAFRQALLATVKQGDVVLDVGAGTGILSLFAAQAGARRVYAVERTAIAHVARQMITVNGFADRIEVIQDDIRTARLPEKVDLIVSEWLGTFGIDENLLTPVLIARDNWLKQGGIILPKTVSAVMAPIWNKELDDRMALRRGRPYGLDLSLISEANNDVMTWPEEPIGEKDFLAAPQIMWTTDVENFSVEKSRLPFRASLMFSARRAAKVNALAAWFHAEFVKGIVLSNTPKEPPTHWRQYLIPLNHPAEVEPGTEIAVEFTCIPAGSNGFCFNAWSVRIGTEPWEHHDTRRPQFLL